MNQCSTAMEYFESVIEETPDHTASRIGLSKIYRELDPNKALEVLRYEHEHLLSSSDTIRLLVEQTRLLFHQCKYEGVYHAAEPLLNALLRDPPPPTALTSKTARTELTMQSNMSRLISSQFVLSRYDVLPAEAASESDVLSQSAHSTYSSASTFSARPALDTRPTVFGQKARGGPKRTHTDAFGDGASVCTQGTSMSDLDQFPEAFGPIVETDREDSEGDDLGASSAVDTDLDSDAEGLLGPPPTLNVAATDPSYLKVSPRSLCYSDPCWLLALQPEMGGCSTLGWWDPARSGQRIPNQWPPQ